MINEALLFVYLDGGHRVNIDRNGDCENITGRQLIVSHQGYTIRTRNRVEERRQGLAAELMKRNRSKEIGERKDATERDRNGQRGWQDRHEATYQRHKQRGRKHRRPDTENNATRTTKRKKTVLLG